MGRRFLSISAIVMALPLWLASAPIWILATVAVDAVGRLWRFPTLRLALYTGVYLIHEWIAIAAAGVLWLWGGFGRRLDRNTHRALQGWWANSLLRWAGRLLGVTIEPIDLDGLPTSTFVLLSRHASMADAVLPAAVVAGPMGRFVHYVMKRELQWDPALDIVGSRLGNHFVARDGDTASETAALERLAGRAEPESVLVIFPEGTYATPESRQRVVASLRRKGADEAAARAEKLQQLLPPRPRGTLAMLRSQPDAAVVVLGHVGLEGVAELKGLRQRLPLTEPVRVRLWVHPRAELPSDEDAMIDWLQDRWEELDQWVASNRDPDRSPNDLDGPSRTS